MARVEPPDGTLRLPSLTGLRFAAAAMVFGFHLTLIPLLTGAVGRRAHFVLGLSGTVGVDFFFILSGFVLTWSARSDDSPVRFWLRRLVKIYPNHVVTFGAAIVLALIAGPAIVAGQAVGNLFLLQTWFYGRTDIAVSVNPVAWSIAAEAAFYLAFPLLYRFIGRMREGRLWAGVAVVTALIFAVPLAVNTLVSSQPHSFQGPASDKQIWLVYFFPPTRCLEFVLGMFLARIVAARRWPRIRIRPALP